MSDYVLLDLACESTDAADRTITATLEALGTSVSPGNRRDIAKTLPEHDAANIPEAEAEATTAAERERAEVQLPDQSPSALELNG